MAFDSYWKFTICNHVELGMTQLGYVSAVFPASGRVDTGSFLGRGGRVCGDVGSAR